MKTKIKFFHFLLLLLFISTTSFLNNTNKTAANYHMGGWVKLGKQVVSEGVDYDEMALEEDKKNIKRLKLKVLKTSVYIFNIKILYDDGTSENHKIARRLDKGDSSRTFDLIGHHRTIQKIIFNYRDRKSNRGGAQLIVLAKM